MIRYCSIVLCIAVALLVGLGLVMLASTSAWVLQEGASPYSFVKKQAVMVVVGVVLAVVAARVPDAPLRKLWPWALAVVCVLLVMCLIPGLGVEIYGSKRWVKMPVVGSFQPSELARVIGVIALAGWFARWQTETRTFWRGFILPGMIIGLPIGLIAIETDVGSALSMSAACATVFFCAGTRLRFLIPVAVLGMSAAYLYVRHDPVRWTRIECWLDPENHKEDQGMQQWRALVAFGNGGPSGVGLGNGTQKFVGKLTFAHIDFIFPEIGEELGLPFTLGVVLCFVLIAVCGIGIASQAKTVFARLSAVGLTCMIVVPAMQNVAVTTACLPNDGLPLPFISYGGSSIVFALAAVGMLVGIHRRGLPEESPELVLGEQKRYAIRL
ncbi:FtsW/RodA/SpoVE family cell cycle protein [Luteolibacter ambystomatis]|uniref:Probable peptidoglycan glycosyltransferase FtsW n=1 Tax=Luteolibacter ambystomatis TaxID=2824561 RepID=A0A975G646_9BACT|nr:FtsW/RodA/SpoVE family cell cycle protein [Luteolibacter ambystomatis]QUE49794.1 FtsW/RodA/SpoVE family cell cycle protein [Luteolibacter ambystomatis]